MIPHLVIMLSPKKPNMQINAKFCIESIRRFSGFENFYTTLVVPDHEKDHLDSWFYKKKCEVYAYKYNNNFHCPWNFGPRWYIEPKSEFYLALDADVICLNTIASIQKLIKNKSFNAVSAVSCPFDLNPFDMWRKLFEAAGLIFPNKTYSYREKRSIKNKSIDDYSPFYPNCGVLLLNSCLLKDIKKACPEIVKIVDRFCRKNYYFPQIVSSLLIYYCNFEINELESNWNSLETFDNHSPEVIFYHHNRFSIFEKIKNAHNSNLDLTKKLDSIKTSIEKKFKLL